MFFLWRTRHNPGVSKGSETAGEGRHAMRGALLTSFWTLLSRILGFARDAFMASIFGMSAAQGAFNLAWTFPNLFRRLFGEGAVSAAVQPALARAEAEGGEQAAKELYAGFVGFLLTLLIGLTLVGETIIFFWRVALDDVPANFETRRTLLFAACLLPYLIPICMCALAGAPQNLKRRFILTALAPVLLNVVWIVGLWINTQSFGDTIDRLEWLWVWILVGGILQWAVQLPGVWAVGWPMRPHFGVASKRLRDALRSFAPALIGLAALQISMTVDQILIRALVGPDANNYSHYANRMLHLPLALVGIAAMTGAMPMFSRLAAARKLDEMSVALRRGCESSLLLMCAAGAGLAVLAHPILTLLFEHGSMTPDKINRLTPTLLAYLWILPVAGVSGMLIRAHQSLGSYRIPATAAVVVIPINLLLDWFLLPIYGVPAAGWATAIAMSLQTIVLLATLSTVGLRLPIAITAIPSLMVPALAAGVGAWLMLHNGPNPYTVIGMICAIGAGVICGAAAAWIFRRQDFVDLLNALR
jgi:putative peptidoglycan lipid II flippase